MTYNFNGLPTKKINKATSIYKVVQKDSATWVRTTSDKDFIILKKETFSNPDFSILNGPYAEYQNGKVIKKGFYVDNERTGSWILYDTLGKAIETKIYVHNKANGAFVTYNKFGSIEQEGVYLDGKKVGEWKLWHSNGVLALKEIYNNQNKLIDSAYLNIQGKATVRDSIITEPKFPKGIKEFYRYLGRNTTYPHLNLRNIPQGQMFLSFTINQVGSVENVVVASTADTTLGEESAKALRNCPKWIPATIFKTPTSVSYDIDLKFSVN